MDFPHTVVLVERFSDFESLHFVLDGSPEAVEVVHLHVKLHLAYILASRQDMNSEIVFLTDGVLGGVHDGGKTQYVPEEPSRLPHVEGGDHGAEVEGFVHGYQLEQIDDYALLVSVFAFSFSDFSCGKSPNSKLSFANIFF